MIGRNYTFSLDDDEYNKLQVWYEEIVQKRGSAYFGAIGGMTFEIVVTSIGEIVTAKLLNDEIVLRDL